MGFRQYIANHIIKIIPPTRYYQLKANILVWAGYDVHSSARIVSSVNIWGQMPLSIGEDTFIGHDVLIIGSCAKIQIGNNVDIAPRVSLINGSHVIDMTNIHSAGEGKSEPLIIEDGVWIGAGSTIIGGVKIEKKAVIGAGSVVINDIPPYCVAVGNPCRLIKKWNDEVKKLDKVTGFGDNFK